MAKIRLAALTVFNAPNERAGILYSNLAPLSSASRQFAFGPERWKLTTPPHHRVPSMQFSNCNNLNMTRDKCFFSLEGKDLGKDGEDEVEATPRMSG